MSTLSEVELEVLKSWGSVSLARLVKTVREKHGGLMVSMLRVEDGPVFMAALVAGTEPHLSAVQRCFDVAGLRGGENWHSMTLLDLAMPAAAGVLAEGSVTRKSAFGQVTAVAFVTADSKLIEILGAMRKP